MRDGTMKYSSGNRGLRREEVKGHKSDGKTDGHNCIKKTANRDTWRQNGQAKE